MDNLRKKAWEIWENWRGQSKSDCIDEIAQALTEARNEGIEEAAKVSEIHSKTWIPIARAIRQLKGKPSDG